MKKTSGQSLQEEPIGIVIAMGGRIPTIPRVKAYLWYEWPGDAATGAAAEKKQG